MTILQHVNYAKHLKSIDQTEGADPNKLCRDEKNTIDPCKTGIKMLTELHTKYHWLTITCFS